MNMQHLASFVNVFAAAYALSAGSGWPALVAASAALSAVALFDAPKSSPALANDERPTVRPSSGQLKAARPTLAERIMYAGIPLATPSVEPSYKGTEAGIGV